MDILKLFLDKQAEAAEFQKKVDKEQEENSEAIEKELILELTKLGKEALNQCPEGSQIKVACRVDIYNDETDVYHDICNPQLYITREALASNETLSPLYRQQEDMNYIYGGHVQTFLPDAYKDIREFENNLRKLIPVLSTLGNHIELIFSKDGFVVEDYKY
jgi:hypothetical protein